MSTSTEDFSVLATFGGSTGSANVINKASSHQGAAGNRSANKPVEKIALAELLVNHDDEQGESVSDINRRNLNLVRPSNRARRGYSALDLGYGDAVKTNAWTGRFRFAIALFCFFGLILFGYRLQSYANELQVALLSLEKRIDANNLASQSKLPAQKVLDELNEKYLVLEQKISEIGQAGISEKMQGFPLGNGEEHKGDVLYQSLERRLSALEQELLEPSSELVPRIDLPVSVEKKTKAEYIDETSVTNPAADRQGWVVNLLSFKSMRSAESVRSRFAEKGIYTQPYPVDIKGNRWYRLRAVGFPSRQKAVEFGDVAKSTLGLDTYWLAFERMSN